MGEMGAVGEKNEYLLRHELEEVKAVDELAKDRVPAVELLGLTKGDLELGRATVGKREDPRVEVRKLPVGLRVCARINVLLGARGSLDSHVAVSEDAVEAGEDLADDRVPVRWLLLP